MMSMNVPLASLRGAFGGGEADVPRTISPADPKDAPHRALKSETRVPIASIVSPRRGSRLAAVWQASSPASVPPTDGRVHGAGAARSALHRCIPVLTAEGTRCTRPLVTAPNPFSGAVMQSGSISIWLAR